MLVESDLSTAIALVKDGCPATHASFNMVEVIKKFMVNGGVYEWNHIYRETNQMADTLAKYVFHLLKSLILLHLFFLV